MSCQIGRRGVEERGAGEGEEDEFDDGTRIKLPELVNPFKMAFEAGRNLRATLANNLEQITGAASPVRHGKKGRDKTDRQSFPLCHGE